MNPREITIDIQGMTKMNDLKEAVIISLSHGIPFMLESKKGNVVLFLPGKQQAISLKNGGSKTLNCNSLNQWQSAISFAMLTHRKFIPANLIEQKVNECLKIQTKKSLEGPKKRIDLRGNS